MSTQRTDMTLDEGKNLTELVFHSCQQNLMSESYTLNINKKSRRTEPLGTELLNSNYGTALEYKYLSVQRIGLTLEG